MGALKNNYHTADVNLYDRQQVYVRMRAWSVPGSLCYVCGIGGRLRFFLVMLWLFCGACLMEPRAEELSSSEIYEQEIAKVLADTVDDGTVVRQEQVCGQENGLASEECERGWKYILVICAGGPLLFMIYIIYVYLKKPEERKGGAFRMLVVGVLMAVLLYAISVTGFYLKFFADERVSAAIVVVAVVVGIMCLGWYSQKNGKNKQ